MMEGDMTKYHCYLILALGFYLYKGALTHLNMLMQLDETYRSKLKCPDKSNFTFGFGFSEGQAYF